MRSLSISDGRTRRFWDRRAREDAYFFVDNRLEYGRPDVERFWAEGERDLDTLLNALELRVRGDEAIVDIGCGIGRLTRPLAARAAHVSAIDVSPEMLALARRHNGHLTNIRWILGDGWSLAGIEDASADACVSHVVFQHIPDTDVILSYVQEMGRVLRVGGWAAFQVSNDPAVHRRPGRTSWIRARLSPTARPRGETNPAWLGSAIVLDELREAAARGGLELERIVGEGTQFCVVRARRISNNGHAVAS